MINYRSFIKQVINKDFAIANADERLRNELCTKNCDYSLFKLMNPQQMHLCK